MSVGIRSVVTVAALVSAATGCGAAERTGSGPSSSAGLLPVETAVGVASPRCEDVERFAAQLVDVGITYDFQPTYSPGELASLSDVVFVGTLTGGFISSMGELDYVSYEVAVTDVIVALGDLAPGDAQFVSVSFNPTENGEQVFADAIAVGAPVLVFAEQSDAPGGLAIGVEGFATGCPGGRPIGWVGALGEWAEISTLDALIAATRLSILNDTTVTSGPPPTACATPTSPDAEPTPTTSLSTSDTATQASTSDSLLSVRGDLKPGERFEVSFFGPLCTLRGGYLWLQTVDGERVALLRGDGNVEIPIGYDLDPNAEILDDGITGNSSMFILPPELDEGTYTLCTANSLPNGCVEVVVTARTRAAIAQSYMFKATTRQSWRNSPNGSESFQYDMVGRIAKQVAAGSTDRTARSRRARSSDRPIPPASGHALRATSGTP
jgi:hypothetical protein